MSFQKRLVTQAAKLRSVALMARDMNDAESADISEALQRLARALGMTQSELARMVGIDRRTFNPYFTGSRPAGLPTIRKIAKATGRTTAWLLGEDAGRAVVGTCDARGRVAMTSPMKFPSIIHFVQPAGPFGAGTDVLVDPSGVFSVDHYMLVRTRDTDDTWIAWGRRRGGMDLLDRLDGEIHVYQSDRYEVLALIVGMVVPPPRPPSV